MCVVVREIGLNSGYILTGKKYIKQEIRTLLANEFTKF